METTIEKKQRLFELSPKQSASKIKIKGALIAKDRVLIGRSSNCDVVIVAAGISVVHAVLEITNSGARIYDMNSTNGTYLNDDKVVARDVQIGDTIRFANVAFVFKAYIKADIAPPVLDALDPEKGRAFSVHDRKKIPEFDIQKGKSVLPTAVPKFEPLVPHLVYPLSADPRAEFSEYIFEDADSLMPIFKYEVSHISIEVMILFRDSIYSVDYVPILKGRCHLAGFQPKKGDIEYAYLGKTEELPFIEVTDSDVEIAKLPGYNILHLASGETNTIDNNKQNAQPVRLKSQDIIRFEKGDIQIYVRNVESPPFVEAAPLFQQDSLLMKYILLVILLIFLPLIALQFYTIDKELEKEKIPDRIATILYKKPFIPKKSKSKDSAKKPEIANQKSPDMVSAKKSEKHAKKVLKTPKVKTIKTKGIKKIKKKKIVKRRTQRAKTKKAPLKIANSKKVGGKNVRRQSTKTRKAQVTNRSRGHVDTYKAIDFSSTISSVLAKSTGARGAVAKTQQNTKTGFSGSVTGGHASSNLKQASVRSNVGSLRGVTRGKLEATKGAEGIVSKSTIMTAGIPADTVVLGSMDPDVIRRILREHIPQFRYCYQRELDVTTKKTQGLVKLNFVIGASGHVVPQKASVESNLPSSVKRCVANVLVGIQFPEPRGGGVVEVRQPINFYPKGL